MQVVDDLRGGRGRGGELVVRCAEEKNGTGNAGAEQRDDELGIGGRVGVREEEALAGGGDIGLGVEVVFQGGEG